MVHKDYVFPVSFSPDGRTVITGSADKTARLWSAYTGEPIGRTMIHDDSVLGAKFSPDGRTVITGSHDGTILLWRTATGELLGKIMEHNDWITDVAFSRDGRAVIALTRKWIHQSVLSEYTTKLKASRLFPGIRLWRDAYRFLNDKGDKIQVAVRFNDHSIKLYTIRIDIPVPPIEGDPDQLLEEWQKKLSLKLDEKTGKIKPMYPLPSEKDKSPFPRVIIENK
jgi:WD40 repeat protein